jgi:HEAT repeat protein
MTACQMCGARADAQAIAALARCLETDRDPAVRRLACAMLVGRREQEALAALRHSVDDADPDVRALAVRAIAAKPASTPPPWPFPSWAKKPQADSPAAAPSERRF